MNITIAICTSNRCELLKQTLESISKLSIPPGVEWELIIVNNNCTDATDDVISSFSSRLPVKRILEPRPGLSHARNSAVQHSKGDYIVWTDDDVLVDPQWIHEYVKAMQKWPEAGFFGGTIQPWFEGTPPSWLQEIFSQISSAYAARYKGDEPQPIDFARDIVPYGANFVIRSIEQRQHLYDSRLGLRPGSFIRGEEITVFRAMLGKGIEGWWVPTARVRHYISKQRQTIRYLRNYYFGQGEYNAILNSSKTREPQLFSRPRWLWRSAVQAELKYRFHRFSSSPHAWIKDLMRSSQLWGQLGIRLFSVI
jgi:glucosyl-dolichyl phosphate glucuronosyltransferase